MHQPSSVLTMVSYNGETDLDKLYRLKDEETARKMAFIASPEVREALKVIGQDLMKELARIENNG